MKRTIPPDLFEELQERIQRIQGSQPQTANGVSTGFETLDRLLPGSGLKRGSLTEWLGDGAGSGAATLALAVAAHIVPRQGAFVVIDRPGEFYPVAAAQMGIPLDRTVIVHPDSSIAALWAWEQSLRCPGVAVTYGSIEALDDRLFRRLQLAAETGKGQGFLLRQPDCRSGPSWAAARICVKSAPRSPHPAALSAEADKNFGPTRRPLQLSLAHVRKGVRDAVIEVELVHETSDVPLVPQLANPTTACRGAVG